MAKIVSTINKKLKELSVIANEIRANILISLYDSEVSGVGSHSYTFSELKQILLVPKQDLSYHLRILRSINFITQKEHSGRNYYKITNVGKQVLNKVGFDDRLIESTRKKIGL